MTPERLLAAILTAFHETDGLHISFELKEALEIAEKEFDGVEFDSNEVVILREVMPLDGNYIARRTDWLTSS
jgi:hypothetical protein